MAKTKRRYVKRSTAEAIVSGYRSEIISCYNRAYREAWTLEHLLDHKSEWLDERTRAMYDDQVGDDNPRVVRRQLPTWATAEMGAYNTLLFSQWQSQLIWTHLRLKCGRRLISQHPDIDDHSPNGLDTDKSYHCYAFALDGKVVWLPVRDADREVEIQDGRLTADDIDRCCRPLTEAVQLITRCLPNGRPQLMIPIEFSEWSAFG